MVRDVLAQWGPALKGREVVMWLDQAKTITHLNKGKCKKQVWAVAQQAFHLA